jgi:hypothetical protein
MTTKMADGIEVGQFQTSGVNDDVKAGESKSRGGEGSAISRSVAMSNAAPERFAFKRPRTD